MGLLDGIEKLMAYTILLEIRKVMVIISTIMSWKKVIDSIICTANSKLDGTVVRTN